LSNLLQPKTGKTQNPKISNLVLSNLKISKYHGQSLNPHFKKKKKYPLKKIPVHYIPPLNSTQLSDIQSSHHTSIPSSLNPNSTQSNPPPLRGRQTDLGQLFSGPEEKSISEMLPLKTYTAA
jgi:hypothetical protein